MNGHPLLSQKLSLNNNYMFLENSQIKLRALEPEDIDILYKWENDSKNWRYNEATEPLSRYIIKQYIAHSNETIFEKKELRLMIELKDKQEVIGCIDLLQFDPFHSKAGIGILITAEYVKTGYGHNALKLLINYAFNYLKIHQLYAYVGVENKASQKLFLKSMFIECGVLKDWQYIDNQWKDVTFYQLINK